MIIYNAMDSLTILYTYRLTVYVCNQYYLNIHYFMDMFIYIEIWYANEKGCHFI